MTGAPVDPAINGYIGAGYYTTEQQPHQHQQQQQQQYNNQYNNQYNYEEYTHYPHPEEYMNERNRAYFTNGDQYAMPNKGRPRLDSDCKYLPIILLIWMKIPCHSFYTCSPIAIE